MNPEELVHLVRQACEKMAMAVEIGALHQQLQEEYGFANIIGRSEPMRRVFEKIRMVADTRSTVLIEGKSGTGKELVARALHFNSCRREQPFVAINCAALPEALVESELFGHLRGAFTGAAERRIGKFQAADGGTLLVDEVGDMPLESQSKLLRALESRCITPVGSNREIEVDVRIIASTNRNLLEMVQAGPVSRRPLLPHQRREPAPAPAQGSARGHPLAGAGLRERAGCGERPLRFRTSRPRRSPSCSATIGRATSGSSVTSSRTPSSPPPATPSTCSTCPKPSGPRPLTPTPPWACPRT